jgi:hypothetical protein
MSTQEKEQLFTILEMLPEEAQRRVVAFAQGMAWDHYVKRQEEQRKEAEEK